jgi:hypothetical protein
MLHDEERRVDQDDWTPSLYFLDQDGVHQVGPDGPRCISYAVADPDPVDLDRLADDGGPTE